MKLKNNIYLKLNLTSLFFIALSFISVTLAWFAYSGLSSVSTDIGVKAWNIELESKGKEVTNEIYISSEIYPGMETKKEIVNITNSGDADAQIKYSITSARILDVNYLIDGTTIRTEYVEDVLSHDYPFHINISLSKKIIAAKGDKGSFEVSISWPLDSENNEDDSMWGNAAYQFQDNENKRWLQDNDYQIRPAIQIVLTLTAEQYVRTETAIDSNYKLGDMILFDVEDNQKCEELSSTCLETYVIDIDNTIDNDFVALLPNPDKTYYNGVYYGNYNEYQTVLDDITSEWNVETTTLTVENVLKIISRDIFNSFLIRESISDAIIGNLSYENRIVTELERVIDPKYNGYYKFVNEKFSYLSPTNCYWTISEYNANNAFAVNKIDEISSKLYGESKMTVCNIVPVILTVKDNL